MNDDILYLVAALRDGSIDYRIGKNYEIKIGQKEEKWLSEILKPIIERNFQVKVHIHKNLLRLTNKKAVQKLQKLSGIKTRGWNTPYFVKTLPPETRIPYIRGFWDAEGGLPKNPEKCKKAEQRYVSFHQKEKEPLRFIRKTLIELGYRPKNNIL